MSGIKVAFGAATVNPGSSLGSIEKLQEAFAILEQNGVEIVDTARLYGSSEELLGKAGVGKRFIVDSKAAGGFHPNGKGASKENILQDGETSQNLLHSNVDVYYIHTPDHNVPLDETLSGVNELHKSGFFKRFGLSNYKAEDVSKVYNHCREKGYVLPTVYQGNYNAVARKQEDILFPTLRKLGIAFYAYSPLAGGFLTKTKEQIQAGAGRFSTSNDMGAVYSSMYSRPSLLEALDEWQAIAKQEGTTPADLAYRWVKYNSPLTPEYGDALIIGASSNEQLKQTLGSINGGPLSDDATKRIDALWKTIEKEAPLDNLHQ